MARHIETIYSLLKEEDDLQTELESVKDDIVENLYTIDESKDAARVKKAEETVDMLRSREDELKSALNATRYNIRRRLLWLFE